MPLQFRSPKLPDRFWTKVEVSATGCWNWTGAKLPRGYGRFRLNGKAKAPHRLVMGRIPAELEVDHLCYNTACCNPKHLELVTHKVNTQRRLAKPKALACPTGHLFNVENTYLYLGKYQRCRACKRRRRG